MRPRNQVFDPELLKAGLMLFGVLTAILIAVAVLKILRRVYLEPDEESEDVMETIRAAHLAGTMDDAEYQRVTAYLSRQHEGMPPPKPLAPQSDSLPEP